MTTIKLRPWEKPSPVWLVWRPEDGEVEADAREIEAHDAEQAAEDFAEWDDTNSAEYAIVKGQDATVLVREKCSVFGPTRRFQVRGEAVPSYSAKEVIRKTETKT